MTHADRLKAQSEASFVARLMARLKARQAARLEAQILARSETRLAQFVAQIENMFKTLRGYSYSDDSSTDDLLRLSPDNEEEVPDRDVKNVPTHNGYDPVTGAMDQHPRMTDGASENQQKKFCEAFKLLGDEKVREDWKEIGKRDLESLRNENQVLGLYVNGEMRYPAFQFDEDGKPYPQMQEVLEAMPKERTNWQRAYWLVTPNAWLEWKTPISAIKSGDADVVSVAQHAGRLPVG